MKALRIAAINLLVLAILVLISEIGFRVIKAIKLGLPIAEMLLPIPKDARLGLYSYDAKLGHIPTPGYTGIIDMPGKQWNKVKVTILDDSTRLSSHSQHSKSQRKAVLTVGDSFTFGDQVSDEDTWQFCLNRNQNNLHFINGGVGGYGMVQPLLRAKDYIEQNKNISYIIISILVGKDASRDRMDFRSGFPKPSLINQNNRVYILPVPDDSLSAFGGKFSSNDQPASYHHAIANITFLGEIPKFSELHYKSKNLVVNRLTRSNESPPSIKKVITWAAEFSQTLEKKVVWLLQYGSNANTSAKIMKERSSIKETLEKNNIPFIDTYKILFGDASEASNSLLWKGHHSPQGNRLVCKEIMANLSILQDNTESRKRPKATSDD